MTSFIRKALAKTAVTNPSLCFLPSVTALSHERLVADAHELGTSQDSLETSQDGMGCVLARPCMSRRSQKLNGKFRFSVTD